MKSYRIKSFETEDINPEDTFFDSIQNHSRLESPLGVGVFRFLYIVVIVMLVIMTIRAIKLQIFDGSKHLRSVTREERASFSMFALRGLIYDTNRKTLVENVPDLRLVVVPREVDWLEQGDVLASLSAISDMDPGTIRGKILEKNDEPFIVLLKQFSKEKAILIKQLNPKGVYVIVDALRQYVYAETASHITGYTGRVNADELASDSYYMLNDRAGRSGIEEMYETVLRGPHTSLVFDAMQNPTSVMETGGHVVLTLDIEMQKKLAGTLKRLLDAEGRRKGAAIVQNVNTGEVLALVSLPSFDPNAFQGLSKDAKYVSSLFNDPDKPLFNRVIRGLYSPGSTIKPLYAFAVLKEGVINASKIIFSGGSITVKSIYDSSVSYTFRDWKKHGWTDVRKAIADSVDIYFYAVCGGYEDQIGIGIDKMVAYLSDFMLNKTLGIDLPGESAGFIPDPQWKRATKGEPWLIGDTYNMSIGQGDLLVTPLWINVYTSALANGGYIMKPFLVKEILSPDGESEQIRSHILKELPINGPELQTVREGMRQTITNGTAIRLKDLPVSVAGKTGTAQVLGFQKLNSLFTAYAPYEDPEISITVLVEDIPKSQSLAIETAKEFLAWYFGEYTNGLPNSNDALPKE